MLCARVGMLCTARMRSPAHTARGHPEWRVALEGMRTALSEAWADELTLPRRAPPSDAACETGSPRRWGGARTMPGASTRIRCGGTASPSGSSSLLGSPTRCRTVVAAWRPGRARLPRAARLMVTGDGGPEGPRQVRVGVGLSQSSVVLRDSWGAVDAAPGAPQGDGRAAWFLTRGTGGGAEGTHGCLCGAGGSRWGTGLVRPACTSLAQRRGVLPAFHVHHRGVPAPLFPDAEGAPTTREKIVLAISAAAHRLGLPVTWPDGLPRYSGHALRVGGAQGLAQLGFDPSSRTPAKGASRRDGNARGHQGAREGGPDGPGGAPDGLPRRGGPAAAGRPRGVGGGNASLCGGGPVPHGPLTRQGLRIYDSRGSVSFPPRARG